MSTTSDKREPMYVTLCPRCGQAHRFYSTFDKEHVCNCRKVVPQPGWKKRPVIQ